MRTKLQDRFHAYLEARYPDHPESTSWDFNWYETLVVRLVFPPARHQPRPEMIRYAVEVLGITEVDIRDYTYFFTHDAITLRTWNHRKFVISGLELRNHRSYQ